MQAARYEPAVYAPGDKRAGEGGIRDIPTVAMEGGIIFVMAASGCTLRWCANRRGDQVPGNQFGRVQHRDVSGCRMHPKDLSRSVPIEITWVCYIPGRVKNPQAGRHRDKRALYVPGSFWPAGRIYPQNIPVPATVAAHKSRNFPRAARPDCGDPTPRGRCPLRQEPHSTAQDQNGKGCAPQGDERTIRPLGRPHPRASLSSL